MHDSNHEFLVVFFSVDNIGTLMKRPECIVNAYQNIILLYLYISQVVFIIFKLSLLGIVLNWNFFLYTEKKPDIVLCMLKHNDLLWNSNKVKLIQKISKAHKSLKFLIKKTII